MTILLGYDGTSGMWSARKIGDESDFLAKSFSFYEAIQIVENHYARLIKQEVLANPPTSINSKESNEREPRTSLITLTM